MNTRIDPYASDLPGAQREGRLGVGIISAGRVGAVLGAALAKAGHRIVAAHAVSTASQERAENLLPGVPLVQIPEILRRCELVLLAVPDDSLEELVSGLAAAGHFQPGHLVIHTSGRYGTGVLQPARDAGAVVLAIHPAMTFTGLSLDLQRLTACACAVTAEEEVLPVAQALTVEMGAEPVIVAEEHRGRYHAALAHAANHVNTLTAQSTELLESAGIQDPARVLGPLMQASLDNALSSGAAALTGPVARGDIGTLREHLQLDLPADIRTAYLAMARATAQRAVAAGRISETTAADILDLLATADPEHS
ncbi:Rossmann-like and DUF2520 domain-containing protein [Nesterenkonia alba]|uniref:Rossmann-like and DUF2520 domain-containing protein n=1 Tax=Nesterenkonia alba TaxID=515814 RepID=UPI0003B4C29F|nr:DUF2520 domain-containing protein [Nesterenkonia alba]